mmetsp:Transcript_29294/g.40256  ORF Transcript_29294/g.40256 Transcript_29294/m.40256 type:complete len:417 (+) Transcript_29294:367-1617(+)
MDEVNGNNQKSDQQLFLLANSGITVIDQVPLSHLRYLVERAGCVLHPHLLACLAPGSQALSSHLTELQPLLLGDQTHSRRLYYRLRGLPSSSGCGSTQVLLFSSNSLTASTYRRLIRRCLRVLEVALQDDRIDEAAEEDRLVVVPGAGAGELSWSLLWGQVASCLQENYSMGYGEEEVFPSADSLPGETTLTQRLRPLARFLSYRLTRGSAGLSDTAVEVCESLSEAYQAVAGQLLLAAQRLIPVTNSPAIAVSQSALPVQAVILPAALNYASGSCLAVKLRQLWWLWVRQMEQGNHTIPVGRAGVVVHYQEHPPMQMSEDREEKEGFPPRYCNNNAEDTGQFNDAALCNLDDSIACGVCSSQRHFWGAFLWLVGEAKVLLQLGGTTYESSVIVVSSAKHRQWKEEKNNRKYDDEE